LNQLLVVRRRGGCSCSRCFCCLLVRFLCFYPLRSGQTIPRASIETLLHQRVAAAYIHWLIAANGIASHLATSCAGIRLLLLLLALARAVTDITPVLGREQVVAPGVTGWPRDGRSVRQPRRWPRHVGSSHIPIILPEISDRRGQAHENRTGSPRSLLLQLLPSVSSHYAMSPGSTRLQNHA